MAIEPEELQLAELQPGQPGQYRRLVKPTPEVEKLSPEAERGAAMLGILRGSDDANELYQRQTTLIPSPDYLPSVAIVGCGGIGSWAAYFLALAGVPRLELFDSDTISTNNLNRLPFTPEAIGKVKSEALASLILAHRPSILVTPLLNLDPNNPRHIEHIKRCKFLFCSTDSLKSRRMAYELASQLASQHNLTYIEAGADGFGGSVAYSPGDFSTPEEEEAGYRSVPVFVGPCTLVASIACYYILTRSKHVAHSHVVRWQAEGYINSEYGLYASLLTIDNIFDVDADRPQPRPPISPEAAQGLNDTMRAAMDGEFTIADAPLIEDRPDQVVEEPIEHYEPLEPIEQPREDR